jgi:hypothetical protein
MDILSLTPTDCRLLKARYTEHGNSHRRMTNALAEASAYAARERLAALRAMEIRFSIDLASLCYRFAHRSDPGTHVIEQTVLAYVAQWRCSSDGREELWVLLDRVREVRELMEEGEGQLAREPEL